MARFSAPGGALAPLRPSEHWHQLTPAVCTSKYIKLYIKLYMKCMRPLLCFLVCIWCTEGCTAVMYFWCAIHLMYYIKFIWCILRQSSWRILEIWCAHQRTSKHNKYFDVHIKAHQKHIKIFDVLFDVGKYFWCTVWCALKFDVWWCTFDVFGLILWCVFWCANILP